ncbi:MAG: hypothetical protein OEV36_10700, partial [Myxococcales bacterium]|nr:hypothetical protein [Myxococcales bacterium]
MDVVRHLQAVGESGLGEGADHGANLHGLRSMTVRLFEGDANRIRAIHHAARKSADSLLVFGDAAAARRGP